MKEFNQLSCPFDFGNGQEIRFVLITMAMFGAQINLSLFPWAGHNTKQRTHHFELMTSFPEMLELSHGLVHKNVPDNPGVINDKRETGI